MAEEKIEKGVISEEALEEIAGGLKVFGYDIPNDKIKKAVVGAGVAIGSVGIGFLGKGAYDYFKNKTKGSGGKEEEIKNKKENE